MGVRHAALAVALSAAAHAQETGLSPHDRTWAAVTGTCAGIATGTAGALWYWYDYDCGEDRCSSFRFIGALLAGVAASVPGIATGVYVYGEATGHDGSLMVTTFGAVGGLLGLGLVTGIFALGGAEGGLLGLLFGLPLPVAAATGAYEFSLDGGVSAPNVLRGPPRREAFAVPLLSGTF
ncbi:MAG: hypothetical protein KC549_13310 [Myxococcales bacterium]|nr:hypothetical protein [Myxococcales bacterium]MCB9544622.1 hypothetical protein [Myxococcales bacterium]